MSVDLFKQIFSDANSELYYLWAAMFGVDFLWCDDFLNYYMFLSKLLRENQSSSKLRFTKITLKNCTNIFLKKRKKQHIIFFGTTISTPEKHHIFY